MGERFAGRYELIDQLGEGGMASVWRAWDEREGRIVAAKVLRQSDAVSLLRFVREQAVRVASPHVLTPLGWAGEDDRVLFTMPIVDGGSVATLVGDHGPLPPVLAAELLRQLLEALATVHEARLVHRDVKPANLLLAATGGDRPYLLLTDFGIAVDRDGPRFTETGAFVGTPGFVAPEVLLGGELRPSADLYAAGQVGFFMLTGVRGTPDEQRARQPAEVPEQLWSLVQDLTAADPDARPSSARTALGRLGPGPAEWDPSALGDVEVFTHVGPDSEGRPQLVARPPGPPPAHAAVPAPAAPRRGREQRVGDPVSEELAPTRVRPAETPSVRLEPSAPRRRPSALVAAVAVLAVLGLGSLLVAWSPWSSGSATPGSPPPTSPASSTAPTVPATSAPATTPPSPSTPPSSSPSSAGSVSVGTVVATVGQPCEFSQVGVQERTLGGSAVACQRRADGSYAWDPPPG